MTMRFKSIFLDPYSSQPTYNDLNEVLCEVLVEDGSTALAFVPADTIKSIGIILPERLSVETIEASLLEEEEEEQLATLNNKSPSPIIEIVESTSYATENTTDKDYIWSPYRSTPQDHKATKKFIEIISSEPYAEKLKDKTSPKFKIWQQVSNEMKASGFPVAENDKEGGKKCDQKWRNLENKYALYNMNAKKGGGQLGRKKPPYYDMMYAIKHKKPATCTITEEKQNRTSRVTNNHIYETVLPTEESNDIPMKSLKVSSTKDIGVNATEILHRITAHHKEILDMQNRHFEEMKANMIKQNDQRQEMLDMFASLIENTKRKRKRSDSD